MPSARTGIQGKIPKFLITLTNVDHFALPYQFIVMTNNPQNNAASLREQLKQRRDAQNPHEMSRGALLIRGRLFTWLATNQTRLKENGLTPVENIAAFWSLPEEPALQPLLRQWVEEEGYSVSLPVVVHPEQALQFRLWTPDAPMKEGPYGIQEPVGEPAPLPDVVLVPTLGYTRSGDRIGYGKGYYDRTLADLREREHSFTSLGVAWATGDLSNDHYVPADHDERLDGMLTDKGWPMPPPEI